MVGFGGRTAINFGEKMTRLSRSDAAQFLTENGPPIAANTLAKKAVQLVSPAYGFEAMPPGVARRDPLDPSPAKKGDGNA